jgi:hypothetical protein
MKVYTPTADVSLCRLSSSPSRKGMKVDEQSPGVMYSF